MKDFILKVSANRTFDTLLKGYRPPSKAFQIPQAFQMAQAITRALERMANSARKKRGIPTYPQPRNPYAQPQQAQQAPQGRIPQQAGNKPIALHQYTRNTHERLSTADGKASQ